MLVAVVHVFLDAVLFVADVLSIFDVIEWLWTRFRPEPL
jgi:hypothetical protein